MLRTRDGIEDILTIVNTLRCASFFIVRLDRVNMAESTTPVEVGLTVLVLALTTAIASKMFVLSNNVTNSPITAVVLVVLALGVFSVYPAVGIALLLLTAVLMFNRNVRTTMKLYARPQADNFQNAAPPLARVSDDMFQGQMNGPRWPDRLIANAPPADQSITDIVYANRPQIPMPSGPPDTPPAYRGVYGADSIMGERVGDAVGAAENGFLSSPRPYDEFKETDPRNPMLGPVKVTEGFESLLRADPAPFGDEEGNVPYGSYPRDQARAESQGEVRDFVYRPERDTGSNEFQRFGPNLDEKTDSFKYYTD